MILTRPALSTFRSRVHGGLIVLLPLVLTLLAACGPGGGRGAGY